MKVDFNDPTSSSGQKDVLHSKKNVILFCPFEGLIWGKQTPKLKHIILILKIKFVKATYLKINDTGQIDSGEP